jgi:hypothetical protein
LGRDETGRNKKTGLITGFDEYGFG